MKKILVLLALFLAFPAVSSATDCPFGLVNDPAPGECGRYLDENNNNLCDYSEEDAVVLDAAYKEGINTINDKSITPSSQEKNEVDDNYNLIMTTVICLAVYLLMFFLEKKGKLSHFSHCRFWNILLLISFVICGGSGLLLVIRINYQLDYAWLRVIEPHVEFGIIFVLASVFHIIERRLFFQNYFRKKC